jgi:hypothetical protein
MDKGMANIIYPKSVPLRIYFNREVAERLGLLSENSGLNFSTIVNAAAKVALEQPQQILNDAKGAHRKWLDRQR